MINFRASILTWAKSLVPHFLRGGQSASNWVTQPGLVWVTQLFESWGTSNGGRHTEWIEALVSPIDWLNNQFALLANDVYYRMSITGQVIYIEHFLNDLYDNTNRGIYISDDTLVFPPFLFGKEDIIPVGEELILGDTPIYLYGTEDFLGQGSFVVHVPNSISINDIEDKVRSAVNKYKQAGVHFTIERY